MAEVHQKVEQELRALDAELNHMDDMDTIDQLELLIKESNIMERYRIVPPIKWYQERINYITAYRRLGWDNIIRDIEGKNVFLYETSVRLIKTIDALLEQWDISTTFSLHHYQYIVYHVHNIWTYYNTHYGIMKYGMEELVVDMTRL